MATEAELRAFVEKIAARHLWEVFYDEGDKKFPIDEEMDDLILEARALTQTPEEAPYAHPSMDLDGEHRLRMERGQ